ncbi:MAG TPA: prepilin-type N-terminal cleavage/methylation domain-containing protein [Candidatus Saccharimonadales bacterium]|nr:prepilin-type N-terminal cleavage/methylation domain-containing protein [Candidatus Saccharimonadales bacterium]
MNFRIVVHQPRSGFSLIEMMMTILLISVLMAIAIPNYNKSRLKSQADACGATLNEIDTCKRMWALEAKSSETNAPSDTDLFGLGKFMSEKPKCPAGGTYRLNAVRLKVSCTYSNLGHTY